MTDHQHDLGPRPGGTGHLGGRTVARVGYGAMQLTRLAGEPETAIALLHRAFELGVDHVDTAEFYGNGVVNGFLRNAVGPDDAVTVVTKVGADPHPDPSVRMQMAQRPEQLRASVESNLRSLGLEQLPVVNLRRPGAHHRHAVPDDQTVPLDDQLAEMVRLREAGLIGDFGLSGVDLDELTHASAAGPVCVQNPYNVLEREDEPMLSYCLEHGIAWVPFFPLGFPYPGSRKVTEDPAVQQTAESAGMTSSAAGLAWLLAHAENVLLIPGTSRIAHLEQNVQSATLGLDADAKARLDAVADVARTA